MNRRMIWLSVGGFVLLLLLGLFDAAIDGAIDRYRTATEITVAEGDGKVSSKVYSDCTVTRSSNRNTGRQTGTLQSRDPFVVLSDRSTARVNESISQPTVSNPFVTMADGLVNARLRRHG